jgi:DNA (cytosine-5)-methyltransferase 1
MREIVVDNFACGGGASEGIETALGRPVDIAINHNAKALAVHLANHPRTLHLREDIRDLDPRKVGAGRPVGLGWFSPDCTFHSKARGGKPFRDTDRARRVRGLAGTVVWWARDRRPRVIMLENVEEFSDWGPLLENGKPDPARRGQSFRRWHRRLENLGYQIDMRQLRCCDYGAPTSRRRLFVIARCDGEEIVFPEASHGPWQGAAPYRTAAECIDWSIPCPSIFLSREDGRALGVRRPLADATLRRIARGVMRYVVDNPQPFIVPLTHHGERRLHPLDEPVPTITAAHRGELAVVTPFLTEHANASTQRNFRADEPMRTLCATVKGGHFALVSPTLINTRNGEREGQDPRVRDIRRPYPTITAQGSQGALVAAFLARHYGGHENDGHPVTQPMSTITTQDHHHLVSSHIVKLKGTCRDGQPIDEPLHTIQASGTHYGEVRAFLLKYYGTDQDPRLERPLGTVTTKDRFGLVTVRGEPYAIVDIGMRMLAPRELARATSFPDSYILDPIYQGKPLSKTDQVWMIGNAVPPVVAEALVRANLVEQLEERAA